VRSAVPRHGRPEHCEGEQGQEQRQDRRNPGASTALSRRGEVSAPYRRVGGTTPAVKRPPRR
jgi:hypothetical protein